MPYIPSCLVVASQSAHPARRENAVPNTKDQSIKSKEDSDFQYFLLIYRIVKVLKMYFEFMFFVLMLSTYIYKYGFDFDKEVLFFLLTFLMVHMTVDSFLVIVHRILNW